MDLELVQRQLNDQAKQARAESVQMYEEFAGRARSAGDLRHAAYWQQAADEERRRPLPSAA